MPATNNHQINFGFRQSIYFFSDRQFALWLGCNIIEIVSTNSRYFMMGDSNYPGLF